MGVYPNYPHHRNVTRRVGVGARSEVEETMNGRVALWRRIPVIIWKTAKTRKASFCAMPVSRRLNQGWMITAEYDSVYCSWRTY